MRHNSHNYNSQYGLNGGGVRLTNQIRTRRSKQGGNTKHDYAVTAVLSYERALLLVHEQQHPHSGNGKCKVLEDLAPYRSYLIIENWYICTCYTKYFAPSINILPGITLREVNGIEGTYDTSYNIINQHNCCAFKKRSQVPWEFLLLPASVHCTAVIRKSLLTC